MRYAIALLIAASVLVSGRSNAQTQAPAGAAPSPAAAGSPFSGIFDVGGQATRVDGDAARYERYRDMRDGAYAGITLARQTTSSLFSAAIWHPGYRDQRYDASYAGPRLNLQADWTSIPLNFSYLTRTPYAVSGSTLTLDDSAQRAVEVKTAVGVPCAPGGPPAACSNAAQATLARTNRSIYNSLATPFELRHRRDTAGVDLTYSPTTAIDVDMTFMSTKREGQQPWGASFAFNTAVEVPLPVDQRTNDVSVATSWASERSMLRAGWDGSWFNNAFQSLTWDNPIRLTDFTNGRPLPNGPFDPNGYSNGNGPAMGRMSVAPDNMMHVVSLTGLHKMAGRTTLNGTLQLTTQTQNDQLIPWTINSVINTPAVFAAFPHLTQLPRQTAEAEAKGVNGLLNLSARPFRSTGFAVRYRYNKRDVQTPVFDATEYVRFDAVPEEIEEGLSHQFDSARHFFDASVSFMPVGMGSLRVGYGHEAVERHGRGFANVGENIFRVSYDAFSSQFVTVRASVDGGRRRGEGFVEAASGNDDEEASVGPGGTQPTLRYYDEADRNRTRGTVLVTVMPHAAFDVSLQVAAGKDEFLRDPSAPVTRPDELFGLLEQTNLSWNIGITVHPSDVVGAGVSYGQDSFGSFQKSRNANPPPDPSWTDPRRDWTLDNDDRIKIFSANLDLLRALRNTDIRFGYDYSDSDNSFVHGGPRVAALSALGQFIALPNVKNRWQRATADVEYFFTEKVGVGAGYYFDKLDITDYSTVDSNGPVGVAGSATGVPRIDDLGELMLGYGNRPYSGSTGFLRLLYKF